MVQAENGNIETLHEWLELESHQFKGIKDLLYLEDHEFSISEPEIPTRSFRIDQPLVVADAASVGSEDDSIRQEADRIESPWARMEKAANERLIAARSIDYVASETTAAMDCDSDLTKVVERPNDLRISLNDMDLESENHTPKLWWKAPHVWFSLFLHVALIVGLSIVAITAAKEPKLLSIISASVEAENILFETPMEMISELETISELMQSTLLPNLPDLVSEVSNPNVSIATGSLLTGSW